MTIQIRGDFQYSNEYASSIYINNVRRLGTCDPSTYSGSYYTCGSFSVPIGSVTIRVYATSSVSFMYVKISGHSHGSKVHYIHIFCFQIE